MFVLIITILFLLIVIGLSIFGFFYRNKPGAIIVNPNTHTTKNYCSKKIIECDLNNDNCSDICIETETGVEMSCNPTGDSKRGVCSPQIPKDTCNTPNGALSILTAWGGDGPPAMSWDCFCSEPTLAGANDCSFNPNFCSPNEANNGIKIQGDVLNSENYTCDCAPGQTKIDRGDGKPPLCAPVHVNPLAYINFKNNYKIVEDNSSSKTCTKNSDCPGYNPTWVEDLDSGKIKPHSNIGICVKSNDADNGVCTSMQMPDYKSACNWVAKHVGKEDTRGNLETTSNGVGPYGKKLWNQFNSANREEDLVYCRVSYNCPLSSESCKNINSDNLQRISSGSLIAPNIRSIHRLITTDQQSTTFAMSDIDLGSLSISDKERETNPDKCQPYCDHLQKFNGNQKYSSKFVGTCPDPNRKDACEKFCPREYNDDNDVTQLCQSNINETPCKLSKYKKSCCCVAK